MMQAIEGIYRDGKVELSEMPQGIAESRVIVTFLMPPLSPNPSIMTFGMFAGSPQATDADFKLAEFTGDSDDGLNWS